MPLPLSQYDSIGTQLAETVYISRKNVKDCESCWTLGAFVSVGNMLGSQFLCSMPQNGVGGMPLCIPWTWTYLLS